MEFEGLSDKKTEQLRKQPIIETSLKKSMDGNWLLMKTTILDIKPISALKDLLELDD